MTPEFENQLKLSEVTSRFKQDMTDCTKLLLPLQRIVVVDMNRALYKPKFGMKSLRAYKEYLERCKYRVVFEL